MTDILFSDIPVYRVDRTRYYRDRDEYAQEKMYSGTDEHKIRQKQFYENEPGHKTQFGTSFRHPLTGLPLPSASSYD